MTHYDVINNESKNRFEVVLSEGTAFLEYKRNEEQILLLHTEVPDDIGGRGIASALAAYAFEYAAAQKIKVRIYCAFVLAYSKRHPELDDLITSKN